MWYTEEVASLNNILNKNFVTEFIENIKGKFKCLLGNIATNSNNYYRPQHSCGKVMISQASVSDTPRADTPLGRHPLADTSLLGRHTPSWADSPRQIQLGRPPWSDTLPGQTPPGRQLLQRTVRILLECILVLKQFTYFLVQLITNVTGVIFMIHLWKCSFAVSHLFYILLIKMTMCIYLVSNFLCKYIDQWYALRHT